MSALESRLCACKRLKLQCFSFCGGHKDCNLRSGLSTGKKGMIAGYKDRGNVHLGEFRHRRSHSTRDRHRILPRCHILNVRVSLKS